MGSGCSQQAKAGVEENCQGQGVGQNPVAAAAAGNNPVAGKKVATPAGKGRKGKQAETPKAAVKIEIASDQPGSRSGFKGATPKQNNSNDASTPGDVASPASRTKVRRRANDTSNVLEGDAIQAKFTTIVSHCQTHMSGENQSWDERIPKKLCSEKWDDRLDALSQLQSRFSKIKLGSLSEDSLSETFVSIGALLVHSMNDTVRPVCMTALEVFRKALEVFGNRFRKNPAVCDVSNKNGAAIADLLSSAGECLLYRMGDSNVKVRNEAQSTMLDMVHMATPRGLPIVWSTIFEASGPSNDPAILQRLVMMKALISDVGFSKKDGFTLGATMSVAVPSLAIADQKTRTAAMDLVVAAYAVAGERVNKHLHGCKPAMIKILQRKFQEHHDTELFGGNDQDSDAARKKRRNEARSKRMSKKRSNQHSPGASSEDEQEDSDSESDGQNANAKPDSAIPPALTELEEAAATAKSVELLKELPGLGVVLLHKLQSDKWSDRKEGFDQVAEWTASRETEARCSVNALDKREALASEFAAHCTLLQPAIEQSVLPVVLAACSCLRKIVKLYADNVDWHEGEASKRSHYLVPALLEKANGTNQRVQREACKCLLDICHASHGGGLQVVVPHLRNPMNPYSSAAAAAPGDGSHPEEAVARPMTAGGSKTGGAPKSTLRANLVLLKILIRELGVRSTKKSGGQPGCGLSLRQIMKVTKPALIEADSKVRKSGIAVIVELEKTIGLAKVMKYLEGLKPALLRKIQLKIDPEAAKAAADASAKSRSALPPLSDLKPKSSTGHLAPLGSKGLKVLGQKAPLVKPAHVNSSAVIQDEPVARSLDFNSELMDQDDESFMNAIVGF